MYLIVERSIGSKLGCNYHTTENFHKCLSTAELNTCTTLPVVPYPA